MRYYVFYTLLFTQMVSCHAPELPLIPLANDISSVAKQDQFTFIVLDKKAADSFFVHYKPVDINNRLLKKEFAGLLQEATSKPFNTQNNNDSFYTFSTAPSVSDYKSVAFELKATLDTGGIKYLPGSLDYLFFYTCLPQPFKYKWVQSLLGNFKFGTTFFSLLRSNSKTLDSIIYGDIGYWNKDLEELWEGLIFNEITPSMANSIKKDIISNRLFDNGMFVRDRAIFISFLNKVISGEWRLMLIDWG